MRPIDADALKEKIEQCEGEGTIARYCKRVLAECLDNDAPTIPVIPIEWLNERHRECCEEGDTDLMDAITVLCNEYHVWQKEQEVKDNVR